MARPSTPDPIARQLRQEAGFGCCVCGNPILQYHHIVEWAADPHFRADDMMVLCPLHHDQATKGAMPQVEQRKLKANPRNISDGFVKGRLAVKQDYCAADFGSVTVVGAGTFLRIGGEDIIGFHLGEGNLEINLRIYSESDDLLLHIDRNEWISGDPLPWDIEADWQMLTLRERARRITVSLNAKTVPLQGYREFLSAWQTRNNKQKWDSNRRKKWCRFFRDCPWFFRDCPCGHDVGG
jgi:5-methylcytosine-specific restriction endonuclease McrA